ncbi:hypothetical protein WR25_24405 [Diploscapter pachys]|uniref:BED-type domain-containing protein n=1 Tax=Diploscapter pachys TaxID=2018661 RepID=A0A2A2LT90_9BILA|nr:hypothetical protein WR25_24405 [Diploscapter pachys]
MMVIFSKLTTPTDDISRAIARQRNRSLKKSPAVQDDEPSHPTDTRRASSFDISQSSIVKLSPAPIRPGGSFDASRVSAFSPIDVPRLLVHSPVSPLHVDPPSTLLDARLLTVPSPDFRKSPDPTLRCSAGQQFACESPKPDYLTMGINAVNAGLLGQLSAIVSSQIGLAGLEDAKKEQKFDPMDCSTYDPMNGMNSGSLESATSISDVIELKLGSSHQPTSEMLSQMPSKAAIQDDIRCGNGRFQLVRKRGRSEVWNLFGQVMDTITGQRLPYVACYACKVLYTDTGGGTGNMTRHRCPIGVSYRSTHGSSTETIEAGLQSSFESSVSAINPNSSHRGEVLIGDVDRDLLTDSIVKCCALDLIDPQLFAGRGFRNLLERIWQLARRVGGTPSEFFPDTQSIKSALQTHLRFCTDDLKNELSRTSQGVRLSLESLSYYGKEYRVVHGCRIGPDWKWRSNILGVFKSRENESLPDIVNIVIHNYELDRNLLRVTCSSMPKDTQNIKVFLDVKVKLKEVLQRVLASCTIPVLAMLNAIDSMTKAIIESDVRLPFEYPSSSSSCDDLLDVYRLLIEWNEHYSAIEEIIRSKCQGLVPMLANLNANHLRDLELFIDPFKETIESLTSEDAPNLQKVLPEWFALMHECHIADDEPSPLLRELKQKASELLEIEKATVITVEHRIAAILNPRLIRKLNMICTEAERNQAFERIRAVCGIRSPKEPLSRGSSFDGEPHRKRRMFLSSLEDDPVGDDELECYLRSQYPAAQTRDVVTFWSTVGQSQFPSLASLARRTLSIPATAPKTMLDEKLASVSPDQLHTFLMLRSMFASERDD